MRHIRTWTGSGYPEHPPMRIAIRSGRRGTRPQYWICVLPQSFDGHAPYRGAVNLSSGYWGTPGQPEIRVRLCNLNCAGTRSCWRSFFAMLPERFNMQGDCFSYVCGDLLNRSPRRDTTGQIRDVGVPARLASSESTEKAVPLIGALRGERSEA